MASLTRITLPSPAKINRFLHIIGRRADGYHLLQTVFQFLDHGDILHFELRDDDEIKLYPHDVSGIPFEQNLIYRAALLLQQQMLNKRGISIHIEKNLPLGAGLGGGSSNAGTTLVALNALWELNIPRQTLMDIGLKLGADVPVFVFGHTAFGEGVGEQLTPITLDECWVTVIIPDSAVLTAKMYADSELTRNTQPIRIGPLAKDELEAALAKRKNDFEPVVRKHYPEVDAAMKWLSDFGPAQLSGSGASVFTCSPSQAHADAILAKMPSRFKGFVAKGTNISALYEAAVKNGFKCLDWGVAKR